MNSVGLRNFFKSEFFNIFNFYIFELRELLPIDIDANLKNQGYHITYYYHFGNGITLFKWTTTLDGKT